MTLADDSVIEIQVPLDSRNAKRWLRFKRDAAVRTGAWFGKLEHAPVEVRWTEDKSGHVWQGYCHRVVSYDAPSRRVTIAVRVDGAEAASSGASGLPLVDGMFCQVIIPGREMEGVYRLPSWAVNFEGDFERGSVYVSNDKRLKTKPVRIVHRDENAVYVSDGLSEGDVVVVTRLVNPLPNSLLDVDMLDKFPTESS